MKPTIEKVSNKTNFNWRIHRYHRCSATFDWHYHFEYEIVLQRNFTGKKFVGDYIGDVSHNNLAIYGPKLPHTVFNSPDFECIDNTSYIIWLSHEWISQLINQQPDLACLKPMLNKSVQGLEFGDNIGEQVYQLLKHYQEFSPAVGFNRIIEVLILLSEAKEVSTLNRYSLPALEGNPKEIKLVKKLSNYIENNYHNNIQIKDLCREIHVSQSTVYRLFSRHFVSSFSDHIKEFRIGKACELLVNTNHSVASIANVVGFDNLSNFNRQFKQCKQMTPKQFRDLFT